MTERLYTLHEAKLMLGRKECETDGHDYRVLEHGSGDPHTVLCNRCGQSWPIVRAAARVRAGEPVE